MTRAEWHRRQAIAQIWIARMRAILAAKAVKQRRLPL